MGRLSLSSPRFQIFVPCTTMYVPSAASWWPWNPRPQTRTGMISSLDMRDRWTDDGNLHPYEVEDHNPPAILCILIAKTIRYRDSVDSGLPGRYNALGKYIHSNYNFLYLSRVKVCGWQKFSLKLVLLCTKKDDSPIISILGPLLVSLREKWLGLRDAWTVTVP